LINDQLAAVGGVAAAPLLCPLGLCWVAVSEYAIRFRHALTREVKRQLDAAVKLHPILVTALYPNDRASVRFARYLGFAIEYGFVQDDLLVVVYRKSMQKAA
jgi:hypothetical protein